MQETYQTTMHIPTSDPQGETTIYETAEFSFKPGITVLVGCNGAGKTTLLKRIRHALKKADIPCLLHEHNAARDQIHANLQLSTHLTLEDYDAALAPNWQSEGEGHVQDLATILPTFGHFVMKGSTRQRQRWLLLDGMESGLSIDAVEDINELIDTIRRSAPTDVTLYLIVATNAYEITKGRDCIDVTTAKHLSFDTYEEYAAFIRKTRQQKRERHEITDEEWENGLNEDEAHITDAMSAHEDVPQPHTRD